MTWSLGFLEEKINNKSCNQIGIPYDFSKSSFDYNYCHDNTLADPLHVVHKHIKLQDFLLGDF